MRLIRKIVRALISICLLPALLAALFFVFGFHCYAIGLSGRLSPPCILGIHFDHFARGFIYSLFAAMYTMPFAGILAALWVLLKVFSLALPARKAAKSNS
jgi:hypothetical protein